MILLTIELRTMKFSFLNPLTIILLVNFVLFPVLNFAQKPVICNKVDQTILIDGKLNDWKIPLQFFDKSTKATYSFSQSADYLYAVVRVSDTLLQDKLMKTGMVLEIRSKEKKSPLAVYFPLPIKTGQSHDKNDFDRGIHNRKERFVESNFLFKTKGFDGLPLEVKNPAPNGLQAAILFNEAGDFIYEIQIPLKSIRNKIIGFDNEDFKVIFTFPALPSEKEKSRNPDQMASKSRPGKGSGMGQGPKKGSKGMSQKNPLIREKQQISTTLRLK